MILVFGKTGQVASELSKLVNVLCIGREVADLQNPQSCYDEIIVKKPRAVINAAAYTNVDQAENNEALVDLINAKSPIAMAQACKELQIPFLHLSSDYVFDGSGEVPRNVGDPTHPLGVYGASKLSSERGINALDARTVILRTSWVFSETGKNFVCSMLSLSDSRTEISVVNDQIGGPTSAKSISEACMKIIECMLLDDTRRGTYHFTGFPDVSWADFATEIYEQSKCKTTVKKIVSSDYPTIAWRPLNSRLNCLSLENDFKISRPDWRSDLRLVLKNLGRISSDEA